MIGLTSSTSTYSKPCPHHNGWWVTVRFWIFSKYVFVCSDCGHHYEVKGETQ